MHQQVESKQVPLRVLHWKHIATDKCESEKLASSYQIYYIKFCLLCMFLCTKLGITPVFCNMLYSVKMQRKAHIYSSNLKNLMYSWSSSSSLALLVPHLLLIVHFCHSRGKLF